MNLTEVASVVILGIVVLTSILDGMKLLAPSAVAPLLRTHTGPEDVGH